jgi:hypothetical protein
MSELLRTLTGGELIGLTAVVLGAGLGIPLAIFAVWTTHRHAESELQLKRDMVAAGFTPDEIERVVATTVGAKVPSRPSSAPAGRERV